MSLTNKEINDNSKNQKNNSTGKKLPSITIDIIPHIEKEIVNESKNNNNNLINNKISLTPINKRRKSSNINNVKLFLQNSLKAKRSSVIKEKESLNCVSKKEKESNCEIISPKQRKSINYNNYDIINNNAQNNVILNLFQYANNIYQNDEHFYKNIISKNDDIYRFSSNKTNSFINKFKPNSIIQKKLKLRINFGLNENDNNIYKKRISKENESIDTSQNKVKNSFTQFLEYNKRFSLLDKNKKSNLYNTNGDGSKSSKYNFMRLKTFKKKNFNYLGKISEENVIEKIKPKSSIKVNNKKQFNSNTNMKSPMNNDVINNNNNNTAKEVENKIEEHVNEKKKKKKFFLFCCLSSNDNEED